MNVMKLKKLFAIFISVSLLASCDFMDCNESDYYSLKEIQGSYNRVKQFVTDVYGYICLRTFVISMVPCWMLPQMMRFIFMNHLI